MPTFTTDQNLALPTSSENANGPAAFTTFAGSVEPLLVKKYESATDRSLRNPNPRDMELSSLADLERFDYWDADTATWLPLIGGLGSSVSRGVIARGNRTTSSTATTGEVGVLRLDNVSVTGGHVIRIATGGLVLASTVAGDLIEARIRINNGGTATTGSAQYGALTDTALSSAGNQRVLPLVAFYLPSADETLSILLSVVRVSGTGSVNIQVTGVQYNIHVVVEDMGVDPGDIGVDI